MMPVQDVVSNDNVLPGAGSIITLKRSTRCLSPV